MARYRKVTIYWIIYQHKFVYSLAVICISLFQSNFIFLNTIILQIISREKATARWNKITNICGKNHFSIQIHHLRCMCRCFLNNLMYWNQRLDFLFLYCCQLYLWNLCFCFSDEFLLNQFLYSLSLMGVIDFH